MDLDFVYSTLYVINLGLEASFQLIHRQLLWSSRHNRNLRRQYRVCYGSGSATHYRLISSTSHTTGRSKHS